MFGKVGMSVILSVQSRYDNFSLLIELTFFSYVQARG